MKYLVLRSFRCYGRTLRKGEVVDESAIRSPRLRRSEGKIMPAIEEPLQPQKPVDTPPTSADNTPAVISSGGAEQKGVAAPPVQSPPIKEGKSTATRLSFSS